MIKILSLSAGQMYNDIKRAIKHTGIYSLGNISAKLVGFVLLPLYTTHLSTSEFGIFGLLDITHNIIVQMLQLSLYNGFQRWYYDSKYSGKQNSIFFTLIVFLFLLNLFLIPILFIFSQNLSVLLFSDIRFSHALRIMFIGSFLNVILSIPQSLLRLKERSTLFIISNLIRLSITLSLTILLITKYNRSINGIYEAQLIGAVVYALILSKFIWENTEIKFEYIILKELIIFSYPLALATFAGMILSSVDRYILNFIIKENSLVQVGLYSLAIKITNVIKTLIIDSFKMASPAVIFQQIDKKNNKRFYSKIFTYFSTVLVSSALLLSMFSREVIILITRNREYLDAFKIIPILSFGLVFWGMVNVLNYGLAIVKKTKIMSMMVFWVAIINLILNILFIPLWESYGAAWANLFSQVFFFSLIYYFAQRYYPIPYEIWKIGKMLLTAIFLLLLSLMLTYNLIINIMVKIFLILLFPCILYFWNFFEEIEILRIKQTYNYFIKKWF